MKANNNIWKNIESIVLDTVHNYTTNVNSIQKSLNKSNTNKDGSEKQINITTEYLGAIKQLPALLKEIYELMPNINTLIRIGTDIGETINTEILQNELSSTDFYINQDNLKKIKFTGYDAVSKEHRNKYKTTLDIEITINALDFNSSKKEKISYRYEDAKYNKLLIWIDPLKFEPRKLLNIEEQNALKQKYKIKNDSYVVMGGSVDEREFYSLLAAIDFIRDSKLLENKIQAVIVPRKYTEYMLMKSALQKVEKHNKQSVQEEIILVKEKGVLADLYSIADVVFIGDTLFHGSGQNPLEPAFYGKRIISGEYFSNNIKAYEGLNNSGLLTHINTVEELVKELTRIVPKEELETYQKNAQEFIKSEQGAAKEYKKVIQKILYQK